MFSTQLFSVLGALSAIKKKQKHFERHGDAKCSSCIMLATGATMLRFGANNIHIGIGDCEQQRKDTEEKRNLESASCRIIPTSRGRGQGVGCVFACQTNTNWLRAGPHLLKNIHNIESSCETEDLINKLHTPAALIESRFITQF